MTFKEVGPQERARLVLPLRNNSARAGPLDVRLIGAGGAVYVAGAQPRAGTALRVHPAAGTRVEPRSVTSLVVTVVRPVGAKTPAAGHLIARLGGPTPVGPALVELTALTGSDTGSGTVGPKPLAFAQEEATLGVSRPLGPLSRPVERVCDCDLLTGDSVKVGTRGADPKSASTLLNSDSGGSAKVMLTRRDDSSSELRVSEVTKRGTYGGKLTLDPDAEKPRALALTVNVRDSFLWALLFLGAGIALGAFITGSYDSWRRRNLLQKAIKDAVNPYLAARRRNTRRRFPDDNARYYLDYLLPADRDHLPYPAKKKCRHSGHREVAKLYCDTYGLESDDAFTAAVAAITETTVQFDRWLRVESAVDLLKRGLGRLPDQSPMRLDAQALLLRTYEEPLDDAEAAAVVAVVRAEARFAVIYREVRQRFDHRDADWRKARPSLDPDPDVKALAEKDVWARTPAEINHCLRPLLVKLDLLREPDRIPPDKPPAEQRARLDDLVAATPVEELLERAGAEIALFDAYSPRKTPVPTVDARSPQLIYAQVRAADWGIFGVASALTAIAYLLTKYDADWGSLEDYLLAFAAGATVPTAAHWALLPFKRSYNALGPGPTTAPTVKDDAARGS